MKNPIFPGRRPIYSRSARSCALWLILAFTLAAFPTNRAVAAENTASGPAPATSAVIRDGSGLRLSVGGRILSGVFAEIYNYPDENPEHANQPVYGSKAWPGAARRVMDQAVAAGASLILVHVWWSDLDRSATPPPASAASRLDFAQLDAFMNEARKRGLFVMPILGVNNRVPPWWRALNRFPATAAHGAGCDFCETDSLGVSYGNPSMGAPAVRQDFGDVMRAVIARYRSHPALAGWSFGLGPTGEDYYGPNYILVRGLGDFAAVGETPLRFTGYSPFFIREFAAWLKRKYGGDAALAAAWNDPSATLAPFVMPPPSALIADPSTFGMREFPDEAFDAFGNNPGLLTQKGRDFYAFRQQMRRADSDFYAKLIKTADPDHALVFCGLMRESLITHPLVDGVIANPNVAFSAPLHHERNQLWKYVTAVRNIAAHGKLPMIAMEDQPGRGPSGGARDSREQLDYMTAFGQSMACAGAMPGYAADMLDPASGPRWLPSWQTPEAIKVAAAIASYVPAPGCACALVSTLYRRGQCDQFGRPKGCDLLDKAYAEFCNAPLPAAASRAQSPMPPVNGSPPMGRGMPPAGQSGQTAPGAPNGPGGPEGFGGSGGSGGRCGDGVCGPMERQTGMCPADCG